jgi:hypothetical protein
MANLDNAKEIGFGVVSANNISTHAPQQITKSATAPATPASGDFWFDTDDYAFKFYDGSQWQLIKNAFSAIGGATFDAGLYRYHLFTSSGTFTTTKGTTEGEILIVAGGGGGGSWVGGGGGAGGLVFQPINITVGNQAVIVGAGGVGSVNPGNYSGMPNGSKGSNSSAFGLTAIGGGMGSSHTYNNTASWMDGGSGGGNSGTSYAPIGQGTSGQGNNGGYGHGTNPWATGGGGGYGGAGQNRINGDTAGAGGIGGDFSEWATATQTGDSGYYAGGGGGGKHDPGGTAGAGGLGGGGNGLVASTGKAQSGQNNTGGGGGGNGNAGGSRSEGGNGGSGIVIIRYPI